MPQYAAIISCRLSSEPLEGADLSVRTTKPNMPADMDQTVIGIIGMGLMGKMYARKLSAAGWR